MPMSMPANLSGGMGSSMDNPEFFPSPIYKYPSDQQLFVWASAILCSVIGLFGILSNLLIIWITVKHRKNKLSSTCSQLLAVNAFYDILVGSSTLVGFVLTPLGWNVYSGPCFWLNAVPAMAYHATFLLLFFIAIDRFLATFFPLWHRLLPTQRYVSLLTCISALFGIGIFFYGNFKNLFGMKLNSTPMLKCTLWDGVISKYQDLAMYCSIGLALPSIACYLLIALKIWRKSVVDHTAQQETVNRHLLRSMAVLVLIILSCWVLSWGIQAGIRWIIPQPVPLGYILMNTTLTLVILNGSANGFVLFFCSAHYRRIMTKELAKIMRKNQSNTNGLQSIHNSVRLQNNPSLHVQRNRTNGNSQICPIVS